MSGISILISSRWREVQLGRAIRSFEETATNPTDLEFIIRADFDDEETQRAARWLSRNRDLKLIVGKQSHHAGHADRLWEMANLARGSWIIHFNDDAFMHPSCKGWDEKLMRIPTSGIVVFPDREPGDDRPWGDDEAPNFPILPGGWWREFGLTKFASPTDLASVHLLCYGGWEGDPSKGWSREILKGLSFVHQQRYDELVSKDPGGRPWDNLEALKAEYAKAKT